jgi:putative restriction endonuclease
MPSAFIGITDSDWYEFLSHRGDLLEVNFWQPSGHGQFRALEPGELFLFKLHSPNNYIVGGGFFATSSLLPVSLAWETFGPMNGVASLESMRRRIEKYRRAPSLLGEDYTIGNIVLEHPFFLAREAWIPSPVDFPRNVVRGMTYDMDQGSGRDLWEALQDALSGPMAVMSSGTTSPATVARMFSDPVLARRRLGQGAFRVLVTESYEKQCAVTGEHTLPVLQAAHIKPVAAGGEHSVRNGLLLRSDVHTLFDRGYVTITPDFKFRVSHRLDRDWQNGKIYYALDRRPILLPRRVSSRPDPRILEWHADEVFLK